MADIKEPTSLKEVAELIEQINLQYEEYIKLAKVSELSGVYKEHYSQPPSSEFPLTSSDILIR